MQWQHVGEVDAIALAREDARYTPGPPPTSRTSAGGARRNRSSSSSVRAAPAAACPRRRDARARSRGRSGWRRPRPPHAPAQARSVVGGLRSSSRLASGRRAEPSHRAGRSAWDRVAEIDVGEHRDSRGRGPLSDHTPERLRALLVVTVGTPETRPATALKTPSCSRSGGRRPRVRARRPPPRSRGRGPRPPALLSGLTADAGFGVHAASTDVPPAVVQHSARRAGGSLVGRAQAGGRAGASRPAEGSSPPMSRRKGGYSSRMSAA